MLSATQENLSCFVLTAPDLSSRLNTCIDQLQLGLKTDVTGVNSSRNHSPGIQATLCHSIDDLRKGLANCSQPVQLVLVSLDLLGQSTAEQLASLYAVSSASRLLPIVVAKCESDERLSQALSSGAVDYITENLSLDVIRLKLESIYRQGSQSRFNDQKNSAMLENYEHLLHEQQVAKQVFDKVALEMIELDNVRYWMSPLDLFNGDVLLSTPTPSGGLLLLMGDFTGHGLGAAIGAIPLASTFYGMASKGFALQDIIKEINKKLHETLPVGIFCCATAIQLDFSSGELEIWNAGLPDALILRKAEEKIETVSSSALALGILSPQVFTFDSQRMKLEVGDRIYLLSDGLSETKNSNDIQYGEDRLKSTLLTTLKKQDDDSVKVIKDDVLEFLGHTDRADDISIVEVSCVTEDDFSSNYQLFEKLDFQNPVSWALDFEFRPETLKYEDPVPLILRNLIEEPSLRRFSGRLFSIVSELFNNALDHGLLKLDSSLKHGSMGFTEYYEERLQRLNNIEAGYIRCKLDYKANSSGGELIVEMIDSGEGFDYHSRRGEEGTYPNLHGRGLALLQSITESLEFLGSGNHVKAVFRWC